MKKLVGSLFLFFIVGWLYSQTPSATKEKITNNKDTIKKEKTSLLPLTLIKDTLFEPNIKYLLYKKNAHASYYADKFHGRRTASGKPFNMNALTAAHKKLPFGTRVRVTNEANGKSVIVEINDRGPFVKSREIDLSKKAFMTITHAKGAGAMKVTIETIVKK